MGSGQHERFMGGPYLDSYRWPDGGEPGRLWPAVRCDTPALGVGASQPSGLLGQHESALDLKRKRSAHVAKRRLAFSEAQPSTESVTAKAVGECMTTLMATCKVATKAGNPCL